MINITNAEASSNILTFAAEGRLTQAKWHDRDSDGREIACLLGSIHPSVGSAADCNGDLMPMWLAELTPALFDGIPTEDVVSFAIRYGTLVARWHMLSTAQWDAILTCFLVRCIDEAIAAARPAAEGQPYWAAVEKACTDCRAAISSNDGSARAAAEAAARGAAEAAARTARTARTTTRGAAETAWTAVRTAWTAVRTAWTAVRAAVRTVRAAVRAAMAADTAAGAAGAAATTCKSMFAFLLDQIETELAA